MTKIDFVVGSFCYAQNHTARRLQVEINDDEDHVEGTTSDTSAAAKEEAIFQETYKETTGAKATKSRGVGYLANQKRQKVLQEQMIQQRLQMLEQKERDLNEKLARHDKEKEAEREALKASLRQELMGEFQLLIAQNRQALPNEVTLLKYI